MQKPSTVVVLVFAAALLASSAGCGKDKEKMSDAELGLNAQQAQGRRIYNLYCLSCHPAYSTHGNKGPGLEGLYKKAYFPSGLTATDEHVTETIERGRNMMPGFHDQLSQQDIQDLVAYLHTL